MKPSLIQFGIALVIGIAALVGYNVWQGVVMAQSAALADLENQIAEKTDTTNRAAAARSALADMAGDEAIVQGYFVSDTGVVPFIDDLESRGRALGTAVTVASVSTSGIGARTTLALSLTIIGGFDAVMRTVGAIEYAPHNITISSFSLGQADKDSWRVDLKLSVGSSPATTATSTKPLSP
ncbi:hypothetical protein A3A36_02025 [Candidatus Kaiserbacteria bacterium RIFCSPLOWO2_01_FULL_52_12b]|uniref:General secretion pathway protein GspM n=1 Tax=Candidatus Kaiserbacteria bacterium RIFCSPLOWO2_01_FULL_52_12b TaxID=1798509 RepID=A0A1F6EXU2_9BACT|nr:MAG: hypothetical protein A3A36_02025 [Candidatus Kaiserbacteria bacterium RIFCSPLOWO2_01_FULL_52_12b]